MILVLLGRSGCGKSTIAAILKHVYGYRPVRTSTTRARREDEAKDAYYFMSREEFLRRKDNNEFVEWDVYGGNFYGTMKSELEKQEKMVIVITPEGAGAIKKAFPDAFVVNIDTSTKTSVLRAVEREKEITPEKIQHISDRASTDYYLFSSNVLKTFVLTDFTVENNRETKLDDVVESIVAAHKKYMKERTRKNV